MYKFSLPEIVACSAIAADKGKWPPTFPRRSTLLLGTYDDPVIPREQWGASEWKAYAEFLESSGANLFGQLEKSRAQLVAALRRAGRKKAADGISCKRASPSLLWISETKKRGRKPNNGRRNQVLEVIAIQNEYARNGNVISVREANAEWYSRKGLRKSRANNDRALENAVSRYRKNHNISKT